MIYIFNNQIINLAPVKVITLHVDTNTTPVCSVCTSADGRHILTDRGMQRYIRLEGDYEKYINDLSIDESRNIMLNAERTVKADNTAYYYKTIIHGIEYNGASSLYMTESSYYLLIDDVKIHIKSIKCSSKLVKGKVRQDNEELSLTDCMDILTANPYIPKSHRRII